MAWLGELEKASARRFTRKVYTFTVDSVPDIATVVSHPLRRIPDAVILTPHTTGVVGYLLEDKATRSATSITIRASISGVYGEVSVIG